MDPQKLLCRGGGASKQRRRQHVRHRHARRRRSAVVEDPITRKRNTSEPGRSRVRPAGESPSGPRREGEQPKPMMHGHEKSDPSIVAMKWANEGGHPPEEPMEPRGGAEGNAGQSGMRRTPARASMSHGLDRVRQTARARKQE